MTHNGIDIDQYILLTIYPTAVFFGVGFITKRTKLRESLSYTLQALVCIVFSVVYFIYIPQGGAQGLAIVLLLFGILLLFMARKFKIMPIEEEQKDRATSSSDEK